jgi:hypothetical protein
MFELHEVKDYDISQIKWPEKGVQKPYQETILKQRILNPVSIFNDFCETVSLIQKECDFAKSD